MYILHKYQYIINIFLNISTKHDLFLEIFPFYFYFLLCYYYKKGMSEPDVI